MPVKLFLKARRASNIEGNFVRGKKQNSREAEQSFTTCLRLDPMSRRDLSRVRIGPGLLRSL